MFPARSHGDIARLRSLIERIGKLSDSVITLGPLKIGLDGILAWVPVVGTLYSAGAAILLVIAGWSARVPPTTLAKVIGLLLLRTAAAMIGESVLAILPVSVPVELAVDLFRAHRWSATMLLKAMDKIVYVEGPADTSNPDYLGVQAQIRAGLEHRRVVFLDERSTSIRGVGA